MLFCLVLQPRVTLEIVRHVDELVLSVSSSRIERLSRQARRSAPVHLVVWPHGRNALVRLRWQCRHSVEHNAEAEALQA
jgi:hypothetical protein